MTSEQRYGLTEQPNEMCPLIDKIGDRIDCGYAMSAQDMLEDLRNEIMELRAWGQDWKELAKESLAKV